MTARRLLIVMLVLLGISTLAAALVPQRTLRRETSTTTRAARPPTTPAPPVTGGRSLMASIVVGGKKIPEVAGPVCAKHKCSEPIHVGDQITLLVASRFPTQLEIKEFGLVGFAAPNAPARFELLPQSPDTIGIVFAPSGRRVAARVRVLTAKAAKAALAKATQEKARATSGARGGSARP
jgi:hypothetical protein